ncbi:uncharacterized protein VTP21DRAFT_6195 [Calcarisporiella thermophila]|uniref:uncharacterized protein n=1 Tax=Calcarisporiella thermophila TaxID=911321 RepID=UPI0037448EDC
MRTPNRAISSFRAYNRVVYSTSHLYLPNSCFSATSQCSRESFGEINFEIPRRNLANIRKDTTLLAEASLSSSVSPEQFIEKLRPSSTTISSKEYKQLHTDISNGFIVSQLKDYLKANGKRTSGKKSELIERIISIWNVQVDNPASIERKKSFEIAREDSRTKEERINANKRELHILMGSSNGKTIRRIEMESNASLRITSDAYYLNGTESERIKAKKLISILLELNEEHYFIPTKYQTTLNSKLSQIKKDIRLLGNSSFVGVKDGKLHIASVSDAEILEAKRIIDVNLANDAPGEPIHNFLLTTKDLITTSYALFPVHDDQAMPVNIRDGNYFRVKPVVRINEKESMVNYIGYEEGNLLSFPSTGQTVGTKNLLGANNFSDLCIAFEDIFKECGENIRLETRLGDLLLPNSTAANTLNLFAMPEPNSMNSDALCVFLSESGTMPYFLPQCQHFIFVDHMIPLSTRRYLECEYVPSSIDSSIPALLPTPSTSSNSLLSSPSPSRPLPGTALQIVFDANGGIQEAWWVIKRALAQVLFLNGQRDFQICAKSIIPADIQMIHCESPVGTECPPFIKWENRTMVLREKSSRTSAFYPYYGQTLKVSQVEERFTRRNEMKLFAMDQGGRKVNMWDNWRQLISSTLRIASYK